MATTSPARSRAAASASGSSPGQGRPSRSTSASCGPQAGQQIGWAWKRRSAGSSYSAAQSAHIGNLAIVVLGRS